MQASVARVLLAVLTRVPHRVLRLGLRLVVPPLGRLWLGRVCAANLHKAFGDQLDAKSRRAVIHAMFRNLADQVADLAAFLRHGWAFLEGKVDDTTARAELGRFEREWQGGYIGLTGHIGNWEFMGAWLSRHSTHGMGAAVAKRMGNAKLNRLVQDLRARLGIETLYGDDPATRPAHILRAGRILALVPDQDVKNLAGVFVDWFGHQAYTPVGPARLALAAGVPIHCGFFLRQGAGYEVVLGAPLWPDPDRDKAAEVARLTQAWTAQMEAVVRAHPEQWPWFHARWKTTPEKLAQRPT